MPLSTGQLLNNRYRIVKLLGQGGFGAVYRAWDTNLDEPIAIKESLETSPSAQKQFQLEAKLLFRLVHPNLPRVHDCFVLPSQGMYLVMDFVEGEDLAKLLKQSGGPLPEVQALEWIGQVCNALIYLHAQNPPVIHRDIKPANIKITPEGKAMLVDFGIAKLSDGQLQTTVGARAVTPGFSPNEQYMSAGRTDARTDVYALGATLYALLTGKTPPEVPERNLGAALPAPTALNPSVTPRVSRAIMQAMEMLPENRFQSVAAFWRALNEPSAAFPQQVEWIEKDRANRANAAAYQPAAPTQETVSAQGTPVRLPWRWIGGIGSVAILGLALVMLIIWSLWNLPGDDRMSPTQTALALQAAPTSDVPTLSAFVLPPTWTPIPSPSPTSTPTTSPTPTFTPTDLPQRIVDDDGIEMKLIPSGEFQMGGSTDFAFAECLKDWSGCERNWFTNEEPMHTVSLDAYYIDIYEVTNAVYARCVAAGVCSEPAGGAASYSRNNYYGNPNFDDYPVVFVTWGQAQEFCTWRGARLPTEAEWEKAARGGLDGKAYPWGDSPPDCERANYSGGTDNCIGDTTAVGSYPPNRYGLFDMAGNVWEWVLDWYGEDYYSNSPSKNPQGPQSGESRIGRGGAWSDMVAGNLRVSRRNNWNTDTDAYDSYGFRCARTP